MNYPKSIVYCHLCVCLIQNLFSSPDINECADDTLNNCHANASCTNTVPGFYCDCNDGFIGDGTMCDGKKIY